MFTKKMEKNNSRPLPSGRTNNESWHRVRPLPGGNGKTPGGLLENSESQERSKQNLGKERGNELFTVLWRKIQEMKAFKNSIYFVSDCRLQLTAVHRNRRGRGGGGGKDNLKEPVFKKKTWNYKCVVKRNDKTSDTNDDVKTKTNTKHMKRET